MTDSPALLATTPPVTGPAYVRALVEVHRGLAASVCVRYRYHGVPVADLEAAAERGLVAAAVDFDPHSGGDFVSYALPRIRTAVKQVFRRAGGRIAQAQARIPAPVIRHPAPHDATAWARPLP